MKKFAINEFYEIISEPTTMKPEDQTVVQHAELPEVDDELSVSLRLKHASDWAIIFIKVKLDHNFCKTVPSQQDY